MSDDRATQFLNLIRRSQRGRLKVYLGYGPGVGKTWLMLQEGQRLKVSGIDVVVGLVETHGREGVARLVPGLEVIPRRTSQYHGIVVDEMDIDAVLARKPQVALVDELAHTNISGSRNGKRYQDVQELLAAGIHVISTMNFQHLESLYDTVEHHIGVKVRERIPDEVLAEADQVVNVDLTPEDLQRRLELGEIYPKDRVPTAMANFFTSSNLEKLRELTLRELASQIDERRREVSNVEDSGAPDQIMVGLSSRGPNSARLLRYASRLAGRLNRNWYAVYVQLPSEDPISIDATTQRLLSETLTLANQLGATVFTFKGDDVAQTLLRVAKEYRVGHIVIGKPHAPPGWRRVLGKESVAEQLLYADNDLTIVVINVLGGQSARAPQIASRAAAPDVPALPVITGLLTPSLIVVWKAPVTRATVMRTLVEAIAAQAPEVQRENALQRLEQREQQGSTFLTGGVALPHARIEGLTAPHIAFGITHAGISDMPNCNDVNAIFLILTPPSDHKSHFGLLAAASRLVRNQEFRNNLDHVEHAAAAYALISRCERTSTS